MYLLHFLIIMVHTNYIYTGQCCYITVINETDSDWELVEQQSYCMKSWVFPNIIKTQTMSHIFVEWSRKLFPKSSEKQAVAVYRFVGAEDKKIVIQAANFNLIIVSHNVSIEGKPSNATYELVWLQNGDVTFILIEYLGHYIGTNLNAADWMKNSLEMFGNRTLKQICIPGSHNSGMSLFQDRATLFSHPCNTLTQSHTIKGQLYLGVRYFDIRPVLIQGQFMTGHYEKISRSWQGGVGQSIKSIVEEINEFTNSHSEVIIIRLSHSLNIDLNNNKYRVFNQSVWERLFDELDKIGHLYHYQGIKKLSELTINELTAKGETSAVIIEIKDIGVKLNQRWSRGYFYPYSIQIYDVYSNTNRLVEMAVDQIIKLILYSKSYFFLLSWTLTQNIKEAILCQFRGIKSIKDLAEEANSHLAYLLYPQISLNSYPNIICIDDVKNTEITALALAINKKLI